MNLKSRRFRLVSSLALILSLGLTPLSYATGGDAALEEALSQSKSVGCSDTYLAAMFFGIFFGGIKRAEKAKDLIDGARGRATTDNGFQTDWVIRKVKNKCEKASDQYIKDKIARMDHEYFFCPTDNDGAKRVMYRREIKKELIKRIRKDNPELCAKHQFLFWSSY